MPTGTYSIQVWARNAGSPARYEAYTPVASYILKPAPATAVILDPPPSPASPQVPGASVLWSASASGGTGPYEYKFWLKGPGGAWTVARDYAAGNAWTWNTTGLTTGTYSVQVFARAAGSTALYEAYTPVASYVLNN